MGVSVFQSVSWLQEFCSLFLLDKSFFGVWGNKHADLVVCRVGGFPFVVVDGQPSYFFLVIFSPCFRILRKKCFFLFVYFLFVFGNWGKIPVMMLLWVGTSACWANSTPIQSCFLYLVSVALSYWDLPERQETTKDDTVYKTSLCYHLLIHGFDSGKRIL